MRKSKIGQKKSSEGSMQKFLKMRKSTNSPIYLVCVSTKTAAFQSSIGPGSVYSSAGVPSFELSNEFMLVPHPAQFDSVYEHGM